MVITQKGNLPPMVNVVHGFLIKNDPIYRTLLTREKHRCKCDINGVSIPPGGSVNYQGAHSPEPKLLASIHPRGRKIPVFILFCLVSLSAMKMNYCYTINFETH